jgi:hypothetical protein
MINRPGSEATALSNHHRVAVSLTAIEAPFVLCHRAGDVAHRPFQGWYSRRQCWIAGAGRNDRFCNRIAAVKPLFLLWLMSQVDP